MKDEISHMLATDPAKFRAEIARLRRENPSEFVAYVERLRAALSEANEAEDRPLTPDETEDLIRDTCQTLQWSRARVLAEGVLRVREAAIYNAETFKPLTPPDKPEERKGCYVRRFSSIEALVLGAVQGVVRRVDPRREPDDDDEPPSETRGVRPRR